MVNTKAIKSRISSVKNTKKITKAMQMIAAVKMRKSVEAAMSTKTYATKANELLEMLQGLTIKHSLTSVKEGAERTLYIIITSNRGLCGSYNSNILKASFREVFGDTKYSSSAQLPVINNVDVIAIGNKAAAFARKHGLGLTAVYDNLSENLTYESILAISNQVIGKYKTGTYRRINIIYTNYISGLSQVVNTKQLLPISKETLEEMIVELGSDAESEQLNKSNTKIDKNLDAYKFEPDRKTVLNYLFPLLVEVQLYQSVLESSASEHSSRMIAMKTATESAGEMIDELTLEFNKGRQAAITQEVSEIVSGANALG